MSDWQTISKCEGVASTPVHRLKSKSGLRLTVVNVEGPLVAAYIGLATEADDDDGLPHTLEHLIFLGSEEYPYKGLLDLYANRCFASGTNAWTDVDHTAYTIKTAGSQGMLKILPIYLDHILYPVLTDEAFLTEVYHINGEGKDAGVVYSEMQGRENTPDSRCLRKLLLAAYPNSGYSKETGGLMENLRSSTNNKKVRYYHKKFYRPENIVIIIVGQITCEDIITTLKPVEEKIIQNKRFDNFLRPWRSPVPNIQSTDTIIDVYPTDSEDSGLIMVGWRGPNILTSEGLYKYNACCVLLRYLSDTPIAPFQQELVEIKNPFASDVAMSVCENSVPLFIISLENVPLERLNEALPALKSCIQSIARQEKSINLHRLRTVIEKMIRETLSQVEINPHEAFAFSCLSDVLYELSNQQFEEMLNRTNILKRLLNENDQFWMSLFTTYFHTNFLSVIGRPSTELMIHMFKEESNRHLKYKSDLGEPGLNIKSRELQSAMKFNSIEPPPEIFNIVENVDCDMKPFSLEIWTSENPNCPYFPINELPFYTRIHHVNAQFVYITLLMNTNGLSDEQRCYLPLLLELFPQLPYTSDRELNDHSVLIKEIEVLTNHMGFGIGIKSTSRFCVSPFQQTISFHIQCEPEKYDSVVKLIWNILRNTTFTKERALIVAQKMLNDISRIRRQGSGMVSDLANGLILKKESNFYHSCVIQQQKFLTNIIAMLRTDIAYLDVVENLETIRQMLLERNNVWLHFAANLKKHQFTAKPWNLYPIIPTSDNSFSGEVTPGDIIDDSEFLLNRCEIGGMGCVVGIGGLESYYIVQYSVGPKSFSHPDIPTLSVILQYFTQLEGPFWRKIRGAGLSYSYSLDLKPNEGLIKFYLFKATDAVNAYEASKSIIQSFLKNVVWDDNLLTSAKSSLVYELVAKESTPVKLINNSLINYFQKVDQDYITDLIKQVTNVNKETLTEVAKRWLPHIFDSENVTLAIVCNPSNVENTKTNFQKFGFNDLEAYRSIEESHLYF